MTQQQQQETQTTSSPVVVPTTSHGWPPMVVALAGFLAGAVFVYTLGMGSFWPMLVGAALTAALAFVVAVALSRVASRVGRHMKVAQIAVVLLLALAVALFYRSERNDAFLDTFGILPPSGVSHVDVEHLVGHDNGLKLTILRFNAARQTIDLLLSHRDFGKPTQRTFSVQKSSDAKTIEKTRRRMWYNTVNRYGISIMDRWEIAIPFDQPFIWNWSGTGRDTLGQQATLVWDAASGRACAIHSDPADSQTH